MNNSDEKTEVAGPAHELISASASHKVYQLLVSEAQLSGSLMGAAAVMSGALDGLAHYMADVQVTDGTPQQIASDLMPHFERFLTYRASPVQGQA